METVFWILEGILYGVFLVGDWCDFYGISWIIGTQWYVYSNICKYVSLLLCVWYGCRIGWKEGSSRAKALCGVLVFAAAADYFLLFTDYFVTGILLFCMVQCCYCVYFGDGQGKISLYKMIGMGLFTAALCWIGLKGWRSNEYLLIVTAVFYASLLLQNLMKAWVSLLKGSVWESGEREGTEPVRCFWKSTAVWGAMAILLLFLCDIHVALYNIEGMDLSVASPLWLQTWCRAAGVLMWLFYLPSQLAVIKCIQGQSTHK